MIFESVISPFDAQHQRGFAYALSLFVLSGCVWLIRKTCRLSFLVIVIAVISCLSKGVKGTALDSAGAPRKVLLSHWIGFPTWNLLRHHAVCPGDALRWAAGICKGEPGAACGAQQGRVFAPVSTERVRIRRSAPLQMPAAQRKFAD